MSDTTAILMLVAVQHVVLALGWAAAGTLLVPLRVAAAHWAGFGLLSAVGVVFYASTVAWPMHGRAAANASVVAAILLLWRGLRLFVGQPVHDRVALAVWLSAAALGVASLVDPAFAPWRAAGVALIFAVISVGSVWEVARYVRRQLSLAWSLALALPMLAAGLYFLARTVIAVAARPADGGPAAVAVSFGFAVATMLVSLVFQLALLGMAASRLGGDLRRAARHDVLTGLLNRRAGEEVLADEAQRARRLGTGFALLMLDLDHFKQLNDEHGHAAGDRALQHVSTLLGTQLREIDRLARWGGEEFLVLLPATSQAEARALALRLCERLRRLPLVWREQPLSLTASIGVAAWAGVDDSVAHAVERADAALYEAKRGGRDRVAPP